MFTKKLDYNSSTEYLQDVDTKLIKDFRFLDGKKDSSSFENTNRSLTTNMVL
jgi:hypothetical protein